MKTFFVLILQLCIRFTINGYGEVDETASFLIKDFGFELQLWKNS